VISSVRRASAVVILVSLIGQSTTALVAQQAPFEAYDLADYRLTPPVFEQFVQASGRIADITEHDPAFRYAPLFTKDVALSGDAPAMAQGLAARLENHAGLAAAVADAFVKAGVLQRVPEGAPTINVEFVSAHEAEVTAVLAQLGIRD
jgi:hypothetical protein